MRTRSWSPWFACLVLPAGLLLPRDAPGAAPPKVAAPGEPLPAGARLRLGTSRFRIYNSGTHPLPSFDLSPDGKVLATRTGPWVRLLDPVTGKELRRFRAGRTAEMEFSGAWTTFTRDGRLLVTGNGIGHYLFWDVASGKVLRTFEAPRKRAAPDHAVRVLELTRSADGSVVGLLEEEFLHDDEESRPDKRLGTFAAAWDTVTARRLARVRIKPDFHVGAALSPNKKLLATWGQYARTAGVGPLQWWDLATGKEVRRTEVPGAPYGGSFSPDGKALAVGCGGAVTLWATATGKELRRLPAHGERVFDVTFSPDGKLLGAITDDDTVYLWNAGTGRRVGRIRVPRTSPAGLAFRPGGKVLAWGYSGQAYCLWEVPSGKVLTPPEGHEEGVTAVSFSAGGREVVSADRGGVVLRWDSSTGKLLGRAAPGDGEGGRRKWDFGALSPGGTRLATRANLDRVCRVWETRGGKVVRDFRAAPAAEERQSPVFSADGRLLLVSGRNGCSLWDVRGGRGLGRWDLAGQVTCVALSPDGTRLAAGGRLVGAGPGVEPGWVRVWRADGKPAGGLGLKTGDWVDSLSFSPDGRTLAVSAGERVLLFDSLTGRRQVTLRRRRGLLDTPLVFSPDGRALAFAWREEYHLPGRVQVWEVASGGLRCEYAGQGGEVDALAFSPDGKTLASGSNNTTVVLWDLTRLPGGGRHATRLTEKERAALWHDLASRDASTGYRALLRLAASPEDPVELLRGRLRSAPRDDPGARRVRRLVRDLDDDSFAVRQRAERELRHLGRPARGVLEEALRDRPTPEVRRRVERLLSALDRPGPDLALLRPLRAVEVLERSATPGARKLLEELASGEPDSDLTRAAKAALARLDAGAGRTHVGSPCR